MASIWKKKILIFFFFFPSPIYEAYCIDHYADGQCDQGCNTEECGWDGLDCAGKVPENLADGVLVLVVLLPPEELLRTSTAFLQKLSVILRTTLRFRLDKNGEAMIRPYTRKEARLKRELEPQQEVIGLVIQYKKLRIVSCTVCIIINIAILLFQLYCVPGNRQPSVH